MMEQHPLQRLAETAPDLERILTHNVIEAPPQFAVSDIRCEAVWVTMRDGSVWPPFCICRLSSRRADGGRDAEYLRLNVVTYMLPEI